MTGWSIIGEAGKTLGATERLLSALNVSAATLTISSLESDVFQWSCATSDAAGGGTIVPSAGQLIEVFHNGIRRFRGHVTLPKITTKSLSVTAEGAWWWLNKIQLTEEQLDGTGEAADRPSFVFPTQDLKTSLESLLDSAIAAGVPMVRGTVAEMFVFPRITLSECSYAQALADLLAIVPDAVAWFDYSGTGDPIINITRRGVMQPQTLRLGTSLITEMELFPRLDLEVSHVNVQSVTRRVTDGKTQWVLDPAGTQATGKNQICVISGPEINDFLPRDQFDQFDVQTAALGSAALTTFIIANDTRIAGLVRDYDVTPTVCTAGLTAIVSLYTTGNMNGGFYLTFPAQTLQCKKDPDALFCVISPDRVPEWAKEQNGYQVEDATLTGIMRVEGQTGATAPTDWAAIIQPAYTGRDYVGYYPNVADQTAGIYLWYAFFEYSVPVQLISIAYAALTTIYRQWDYDYVTPPAGLGANLLAAQNWIPWQGYVTTTAATMDGAQELNKTLRVIGSLADCETMDALPKSLAYDLMQGRKTLTLGPPARTDFGTLAARFRRHPKDNITYL